MLGSTNFFGTGTTLLVKFSSDGTYLWNKTYSIGDKEYPRNLLIDGTDIYVVGVSWSLPNPNLFILKYDTSGSLIWNRTFDYEGFNNYGEDIDVDSLGNIYSTGHVVNGDGVFDVFILKYNSMGNLLWNKTIANFTADYSGPYLKIDSNDNNFYLVAEDSSGSDIFVSKYDSSGNNIWNKTLDPSLGNDDIPMGLDIDPSNNIYLLGHIEPSGIDIFVSKYDSSGNNIWNKTYDTGVDDLSRDIYYSEGKIYVLGQINDGTGDENLLILVYDEINGNLLLNKTFDYGSDYILSRGISLDRENNLFVGAQISSLNSDFSFIKLD